MTELIMKLVTCPILLLIANYLFGFNYTITQAILVGLIIAAIGHLMEVLILKKGTLWISTIADFIASFAIIYLSQFVLTNVIVTFLGALITSLVLTVVEYFVHSYLIKAGKAKKSNE